MRRQQNQIEPIVDLINTIFYGDAPLIVAPLNGTEYGDWSGVVITMGLFSQD